MVKKLLLLLMLFSVLASAYAQKRTITGTVTDKGTNETMPGVTVIVKSNPSNGTITGPDGTYSLEVSENAKFLVFSFVGMQKVEKAIGDQTKIDVALASDTESLDEVVVVGYGTESKRLLTSSISDVSLREIEEVPTANIDEALQGKTAAFLCRFPEKTGGK